MLDELIARVTILLDELRPFAAGIVDRRLGLEVAVIQGLAEDLTQDLKLRDPLSERVHHRELKRQASRLPLARTISSVRRRPASAAPRDLHKAPMAGEAGEGSAERAASGSSFYLAMRLLPKEQRAAMYAIYGFCRAVDDIADDAAQSRAGGARCMARAIASLYGDATDASVMFLRDAVRRYRLRKEDFLAPIDGMAMDVAEDIRAPNSPSSIFTAIASRARLDAFPSRCSAWTKSRDFSLAHHLGRALQLTNILRDIDEDAHLGRLYLPRELLDRASVEIGEPARVHRHRKSTRPAGA